MAQRLRIDLDCPLPAALDRSRPNAVAVIGRHDSEGVPIRELTLIAEGRRTVVRAFAMPRPDLLDGAGPVGAGHDGAFHSGFWAIVELAAGSGDLVLEAEALLADGTVERATVGVIADERLPPALALPPGLDPGDDLIAVCMATHEPDLDLFCAQIDSIRAQRHQNWVCVVSDDCSSPASFAQMRSLVGDDRRFLLSRSPVRLGFYRNFERALALAPAAAPYIALADQDDRWYPDKLASLLAAIGTAELIYSDARIVDQQGQVLSETFWQTRRNEHQDLLSLLVANSVTGAASLLRSTTARQALPFPAAQFTHFHDHWLALVARSRGEIRFFERPVYDYVQHHRATLGHAGANRMPTLRSRLRKLSHGLRGRIGRWRFHYFANALRLQQVATVLLARLGAEMEPARRRQLRRYMRLEDSTLALIPFAARGARELLSRRPATLAAEWSLSYAYAWRRLVAVTARRGPGARLRLGATPPVSLREPPSKIVPDVPSVETMLSLIAPIEWSIDEQAAQRVNVLIPEIDLKHMFGGYIGKFNLAARLAAAGLDVRIVTTDRNPGLPRDWRERVESYDGLGGLFDRVEVAFAREQAPLAISPSDRFVATTWRTAHVARHAVAQTNGRHFLYLIQEYEPLTCAIGSWQALAAETYGFEHRALFSTEFLREYFAAHAIGVYSTGTEQGHAASCSFQNAITDVAPAPVAELTRRTTRRLLFYSRPEPHAARNLFEIGVMALRQALDRGALDGWEINGIGTVGTGRVIDLGGGDSIDMLPRVSQTEYGALLAGHDVGLSLMFTPHPSLVPLEMAAAGLITVTNTFENKTAARLRDVAGNLIAAEAAPSAIAEAIATATSLAGDPQRRIEGSRVQWSRSWKQSLPDDLMRRVVALLELR